MNETEKSEPLLDGDGWTVTLADGHSGYGYYAHCEDYPEEGAVFVCAVTKEQP